jgi:hypothetical protein
VEDEEPASLKTVLAWVAGGGIAMVLIGVLFLWIMLD